MPLRSVWLRESRVPVRGDEGDLEVRVQAVAQQHAFHEQHARDHVADQTDDQKDDSGAVHVLCREDEREDLVGDQEELAAPGDVVSGPHLEVQQLHGVVLDAVLVDRAV